MIQVVTDQRGSTSPWVLYYLNKDPSPVVLGLQGSLWHLLSSPFNVALIAHIAGALSISENETRPKLGRPRPGEVFKPKNTQNGNKSRFPGATCIFGKFCGRKNRRARNSASDGQKCHTFWGP